MCWLPASPISVPRPALKLQLHDTEHCKEREKILIAAVLETGFYLETVVLVEVFLVTLLVLSVQK